MRKTAGYCVTGQEKGGGNRYARIELSEKVCDSAGNGLLRSPRIICLSGKLRPCGALESLAVLLFLNMCVRIYTRYLVLYDNIVFVLPC